MVSVHWDTVLMTSKTTPTLQVVVNPLLERKSPVSKQIFASLKQLEADYVRYVPWYYTLTKDLRRININVI